MAFWVGIGLLPCAFAQKILPPAPPKMSRPPVSSQDDADVDLSRLRRRRREREAKERQARQSKVPPLRHRLDEVSKNPGPMRFLALANVTLPYLVTTQNKMKNYHVDPSLFTYGYWKPSEREDPENLELWLGFRLAPLTGTGIYENTAGRFGFTYFGPMIGLGKVSPAIFSLGREEEAKPADQRKRSFDREAVFWMSGLALQSRSGEVEKGRDKPTDFDNQGVTLDVPGLWTEITYADIYFSRISYSLTMGMQLGEGKVFIYAGFGAGFWH